MARYAKALAAAEAQVNKKITPDRKRNHRLVWNARV
jgi:hypothetical protein